MPETILDLGRKVKAKYPGQYDDLSDADVGRKVKSKFPGQYDDFADVADTPGQTSSGNMAVDALRGVGAGIISTGVGAYDLLRKIPGAADILPEPSASVRMAAQPPPTMAGQAGKFLEQTAELAVPVTKVASASKALPLAGRMLAEGATAGGVAAVQSGGDPTQTAVTGALGAAAPAAGAAVGAVGRTQLPAKLYQSALKPTWQMFKKEGDDLIKTGLEMGIPVNANGMAKLTQKIADLGKEIETGVIQRAGRTVDSTKVLQALDGLEDFYRHTAAPETPLNIIAGLKREFTQYHGQKIPLDVAQKIKVNTYQDLKAAYGEMKAAKIEGIKQEMRGLKEQIEAVWPEIAHLNDAQGKALALDEALFRALWRKENKEMVDLTSAMAGASGHALMGGPGAIAGVAGKLVFDNPSIKSQIAIALARAGNKNPPAALERGLAMLKTMNQGLVQATRPESPNLQPAVR